MCWLSGAEVNKSGRFSLCFVAFDFAQATASVDRNLNYIIKLEKYLLQQPKGLALIVSAEKLLNWLVVNQ